MDTVRHILKIILRSIGLFLLATSISAFAVVTLGLGIAIINGICEKVEKFK